MQLFHTIKISEMCGEVVLSQGVILLDQSAMFGICLLTNLENYVLSALHHGAEVACLKGMV